MTYEKFIKEYLERGLLKEQEVSFDSIEKYILRAKKEIKAAEVNLLIDEGVAYTTAYSALLHAGRALMLLKGFRPSDGNQHKTVVEFTGLILGKEFKTLVQHFDKMRKKRNIFIYEVNISFSDTEVINAIKKAAELVGIIKAAIKKANPQKKFKF